MLGKQHLFYGVSTAATLAIAFHGSDLPIFESNMALIGGAALGSLLPDIDSTESSIGRKLYPISWIISKLMKHRTYTHDPILWVPVFIFLIIKHPLLFGLAVGFLGHIFLDSLTAGGIPVFYLVNKKAFHLLPYRMKFRANSTAAKVVTILVSVLTVAFIRGLTILF